MSGGALLESTVCDPFDRDDFRADLAVLAGSVREDWQRWAAQAVVLERLAAQVPSERGSSHVPTAWKSFVREVAVARRCSDQAAAKEIYLAVALVRDHPRTHELLEAGQLPLFNARTLLEETAGLDREVALTVDAELAERACRLTPSRVRAEVRRIELRNDADAAVIRAAKATAARGVRLYPAKDDQASLVLTGPAQAVVAFYDAVNASARAARAAGDVRGLDALRFDLATDIEAVDDGAADNVHPDWRGGRRRVRPVQLLIHLPVTTALGLDNEPGWLAGYGWVSAPQCRQWLTVAELRQVCVGRDGFVVDVSDRVVRPEPTPAGVRAALVDMVRAPGPITDKTWRTEPRHDPSPSLAFFVDIRDRYCDGPTGTAVPAARCETDHEQPYPDGPTAAWNLRDRATRTHLLKHSGWVPLRTATSTLWFSPAGQIVEVPHHTGPPPELEDDAELPDPDDLHEVERELLRPPDLDDRPPKDPPPF